ncbi:MAG TPA: NAD(P)-dependent oxidoreductase [Bryobacteraceae bacterium]
MHDRLAEHYPPLTRHEALVEADRCIYCYDAPCTHACPTHIDIPKFIKKIATDNVSGSARAIFDSNLMGATCARVCPVQELCEGACVLNSEHKPIMIGRLQRYAMDHAYSTGQLPFQASVSKTSSVAVVGAGPAGLSCAGELARRGYPVTVYEKRSLAGGLSTYGIIGLREPVPVALAEAGLIERLGVKLATGQELGSNLKWDDLRKRHDAVFLAVGLGATPDLGIPGEEQILDGLQYIEQSKVDSNGGPRIGRHVVVIGAGNTAIDCATIAKRLGAETVTMVYRRTDHEMTAYPHEYDFIKKEGVEFRFLTQPTAVNIVDGQVTGLTCQRIMLGTADQSGRPTPIAIAGSEFVLDADQIVKAIGQKKPSLAAQIGIATDQGYIRVTKQLETSVPGVYAGGDAIRARGAASTVMAVQDGKLAAQAIDAHLESKHG